MTQKKILRRTFKHTIYIVVWVLVSWSSLYFSMQLNMILSQITKTKTCNIVMEGTRWGEGESCMSRATGGCFPNECSNVADIYNRQ